MGRYVVPGHTVRPICCANMRIVYAEYAKTSNLVAVAFYLGALVAAQTAGIGKWPTSLPLWLRIKCNQTRHQDAQPPCLSFFRSPPLRHLAGLVCLSHSVANSVCSGRYLAQELGRQKHRRRR